MARRSRTPKRLGPYTLDARLTPGGMGHVWRATDTRDGSVVALKQPALESCHGETERERLLARFEREGRVLKRLDHPNIVRVREAVVLDGRPCIVMEYVEGETLDATMRTGRPPVAATACIVRQLLEAAAHAHSRGVVHRDIKPANAFLLPDGTVKLGDFGIARCDGESPTSTVQMVATVPYMSPEQAHGGPVDRRADLFTIGIVAYELLTGTHPFREPVDEMSTVLYRLVHEDPVPAAPTFAGVPGWFSDIVERALLKDPASRYSSADAMLAALGRHAPPEDAQLGALLAVAPTAPVRHEVPETADAVPAMPTQRISAAEAPAKPKPARKPKRRPKAAAVPPPLPAPVPVPVAMPQPPVPAAEQRAATPPAAAPPPPAPAPAERAPAPYPTRTPPTPAYPLGPPPAPYGPPSYPPPPVSAPYAGYADGQHAGWGHDAQRPPSERHTGRKVAQAAAVLAILLALTVLGIRAASPGGGSGVPRVTNMAASPLQAMPVPDIPASLPSTSPQILAPPDDATNSDLGSGNDASTSVPDTASAGEPDSAPTDAQGPGTDSGSGIGATPRAADPGGSQGNSAEPGATDPNGSADSNGTADRNATDPGGANNDTNPNDSSPSQPPPSDSQQ